ncbi:nucleotidyl transferase AbiEii/AbiGii toxin family protein [Candidatus Woesearchaeota archaeon]|nr:nucleotidyl transferase AbiEii/AbiGii toxin family protein [Candidatus Woesearchaeota archaeon]
MIGRDELTRIKELRKTNLYYEEKEYLQYIFLKAISQYPKNFIFKGGTCLRICYGLERAKQKYELDLKNLVTVLPPYEQVKNDIMKYLQNKDS